MRAPVGDTSSTTQSTAFCSNISLTPRSTPTRRTVRFSPFVSTTRFHSGLGPRQPSVGPYCCHFGQLPRVNAQTHERDRAHPRTVIQIATASKKKADH